MGNSFRGRPNAASQQNTVSFNLAKRYPLPTDTLEALQDMTRANKPCRNRGLVFDRYVGYLSDWRLDDKTSNPKKDILTQICEMEEEGELRRAAVARWRISASARGAVFFIARPEWRFVSGLGRKGPLEAGFTFHRLYGFPIIPGSSLKGLALAQAREEAKAKPDIELAKIFGSQEARGSAVFFDAMPLDTPVLEIDIINSHYPDYYQNPGVAPTDWQNPQPVFFLTLSKSCKFIFAVGGEHAHIGAEFLRRGLSELGAGAKTSAGYGYWQVEEQVVP